MVRSLSVFSILCSFVLIGAACGSNGNGDDGAGDDTADIDGPPGGPAGCSTAPGTPQCNNCIDDDGDGFIDGDDIECTGAIDNDEGSFGTGIPGDNRDGTWQDCFYDGNSGAGDDQCRYHTCCLLNVTPQECRALGIANSFNPDTDCTVLAACQEFCAPLTPPNCDCFGCCTMCDGAGCVDIYVNPAVAPNCNQDVIHDDSKCPRCVKTATCGTTCQEGVSECSNDTPCPAGQFCDSGCCINIVD